MGLIGHGSRGTYMREAHMIKRLNRIKSLRVV